MVEEGSIINQLVKVIQIESLEGNQDYNEQVLSVLRTLTA